MVNKTVHPDIKDQTALDCGLFVVSSGYYSLDTQSISCSRPNGRSDFFLYYVLEGESCYIMHGKEERAQAGEVVYYAYGDVQFYEHLTGAKIYWVHFNGKRAAALLEELGFVQSRSVHTSGNLSMYFENILNELTFKRTQYFKMAAANLLAALTSISRDMQGAVVNRNFEYVISLMHNTENSRMTLEEYANICGLSKSQFIRGFHCYTGMTPMRFKNEILLKNAEWYLLNTDCSITEISELLRFDNVCYFSNMFKKNIGMSPGKFRSRAAEREKGTAE